MRYNEETIKSIIKYNKGATEKIEEQQEEIERLSKKLEYYKRKIEINYIHFDKDVMIIGWGAEGIGFGQLTVMNRNNKYIIDSECMSKNFCNQVLEEARKYIIKKSKMM